MLFGTGNKSMKKASKNKRGSGSDRVRAGKQQGKDAMRDAKSETAVSPATDSGNRWTFLTNHAHVLIVLHREPSIVLREVALKVGITERAVQRIIQDLEEEGFVKREKIGRRNHYEVLTEQPLRHPIEKHKSIGDLLNLVSE
ncbi:Sugar-specific transcriptional regulator TrmB [Gimesia alba]|uniref:Sugar-specific transcriptional regulator TrmB n=2 Tax=Gimesia alba TaxID=2527973 RepID=A0A517RID9_9PLAN|nr:Sugar-specific transcriptional regulator TrmB [Gimesia alba]